MFSSVKSVIPKSRSIEVMEENTLIYDEGEPFIYDTTPYSTYLFVFPTEQFTVYSVSMKKAITRIEETKGESIDFQQERYAVINLTDAPEWHGLNQDKRNNLVNHIAQSLFDI